jgi:hypothetical protein
MRETQRELFNGSDDMGHATQDICAAHAEFCSAAGDAFSLRGRIAGWLPWPSSCTMTFQSPTYMLLPPP